MCYFHLVNSGKGRGAIACNLFLKFSLSAILFNLVYKVFESCELILVMFIRGTEALFKTFLVYFILKLIIIHNSIKDGERNYKNINSDMLYSTSF